MNTVSIRIEKLNKSYIVEDVSVHALKEVTLSVEASEFVSIMGPSGSGKSTLMNIIGCLDRATTGSYYLEGIDISKIDDDGLADIRSRKIGFVFQNFNLLPKLTVLENVQLPILYAGNDINDSLKTALKLLKKMDLESRINHFPTQISGGQRQRVAIARALANNPNIILADEPTGSLDSYMGKEIMNIFSMLHHEGTTIIVVTHEHEVAEYTNRVIRFRDGYVIEDMRKAFNKG